MLAMAATPKLLTSECAAHFPRLWNLIESLSHNKDTRRYPIMLDMINFCQEFELWITVSTDHMGIFLEIEPPNYAVEVTYGANPLVSLRLDFFADNIGAMLLQQEDIAMQMLYDLADWHNAILQRTAPPNLPKYNGRRKCPECGEYAVLQHEKDLFCVNRECQHSWLSG
jgi:hypothetical protein